MTRNDKREKFNWFLLMIGYFTAGYLAINWISTHRTFFYDFSFAFEHRIPFVPIFIFGYVLVYLSILLVYLTIRDIEDWRRAVVAFLLSTSFAYATFLAMPVRMTMRPDLSSLTGVSALVTRFYYLIDLPYNCFPSLHVTYPTLAALIAWRHHRVMRLVFSAMAIIVAISVVLVKQHYLVDVVAGVINASLCFWLTVYTERLWSGCFGVQANA